MAESEPRQLLAPHAAEAERAFVLLQRRTRSGLLRGASSAVELDDAVDVWRSLIHMLSGESAVIRGLDAVSLRPVLEAQPQAGEVALPARVDWLPSAEQNRRIYRFLALQLAGRREFGTYAFGAADSSELYDYLRRGSEQPSALEQLFLLAEGVRVQHRIALAYPGTALETEQLATTLLAHWQLELQPSHARACDTLLALTLAPEESRHCPMWLPTAAAKRLLSALAPLRCMDASVRDSIQVARQLLALFAAPIFLRPTGDPSQADEPDSNPTPVAMFELASDGAAIPLSTELEAGVELSAVAVTSGSDASTRKAGGRGQQLDGSNVDSVLAVAPNTPIEQAASVSKSRALRITPSAQSYLYDEWDHTIGEYRSRHCRVHEIPARHDAGEFFERTVRGSTALLAQVRRQFERMRPERYRSLRGLEDGEDFDLNALIEARIESRARRAPSNRVYTARVRQTRDVATLFLLDMSGSTEQPYVEPGDPPARRIIDTLKEALVVMSMALDRLGDSYAIYGFSSQGRNQVEVYPIKAFGEGLSTGVRARIGGIEPKSGTRMGAALRHMIRKFTSVHERSRHLILLSDGYPQDQEYGPDRRSRTYGIEDTAVALREVSTTGTTPFCITVDRAGNDYLRQMCDPAQYLVIDALEQLPRELPKIYRRVVQS